MKKETILTLKNKSEVLYLCLDQILYIEADGNYSNVFLTDGSVLNTLTYQRAEIARRIQEQVPEEYSRSFVLVGKTYLVNTDYVLRIQPGRHRLTFCVNQFGTVHKISVAATKKALSQLMTEMSRMA